MIILKFPRKLVFFFFTSKSSKLPDRFERTIITFINTFFLPLYLLIPHCNISCCVFAFFPAQTVFIRPGYHGEQHVKKIYSTVAIDKRGHALKPVRGYSFTGEDMNTRVPWLLKNVIFLTYPFISHLLRTLI